MGVCLKDKYSTKSKIITVEIENLEEKRSIINKQDSLEKNKSIVNTNIGIIKGENMENTKSLNKDNENNNKKKSIEKEEENNCLNLKKVKSKYIIKYIFENLNEKKKLLFIRYNKFYTELLDINIECYKKVSGRIKIGEINGYGKEYDLKSLALQYKGFYMNGKRNGKGIEYIGENLIFEGEYKNGKRNGKGIETANDDLLFEGEYKNGQRNGKGKNYNYLGQLLFEGIYLNGKEWNGKIKEYFNEYELKFDGEYLEGMKKGKEYDKYGNLIFEGEYLDKKKWSGIIYYNNNDKFMIKNGKGKVKLKEYNELGFLVFEGELLNGIKWNGKLIKYSSSGFSHVGCLGHGYCSCCRNMSFEESGMIDKVKEYKNVLKFEGEYLFGKKNGKGKEYDINGNVIYEGEYLDNERKFEIKKEYDINGNLIYVAEYSNYEKKVLTKEERYHLSLETSLKNGIENGKAKLYRNDKLISELEYINGKLNGKIEEEEENHGKFIGEYLNGNRVGKLYDKDNKLKFEGEFLEGKRIGKEYDKNGNIIFEGEYLYDFWNKKRWNGKGKEYSYDYLIYEGEYLNGKKWNGIIYNKINNSSFTIKNGNGKKYDTRGNLLFDGE